MSEIKVFCLHCGQHIQCDESYRGMQINCPTCSQSFAVPKAAQTAPPPPAPQLRASQKPEATYLVTKNGTQHGPFTLQVVNSYLESGFLTHDDMAWREGMSDWQTLREIMPPTEFRSTPPSPPSTRRTTAQTKSSDKLKPRAKWWIVSTHVVTAMIAFPVAIGMILGLVIELAGIQIPDSMVAVIGFSVVGLLVVLGGAGYSLAYLRDNATTADWVGCIAPSLISASILALIGIVLVAVFAPQIVGGYALNSLVQIVAFSVMTVNGFRELEG
jgi:hypothetical protein